jgi:membrane protein
MGSRVTELTLRIARRSQIQKFWWIFQRACGSAYRDNAFGIAKGAAYSGLLSFLPIFTTVTALLIQANANRVSAMLTDLLFEVVPPGTQDIIRAKLFEGGSKPMLLLITSTFLSLLAASGLMMSLMEGFRAAYRIPRGRSFWRQRGMAAVLVFTAALPVVAASALMVFGQQIQTMLLRGVGVLSAGEEVRGWVLFFGLVMRYFIALGAIVSSIASLYYLGPNHPDGRPRNVWPGATLATIVWLIATIVFAWYVRNIANYNVMYGSIAGVIALLVWMYVLSVIALIGCEFNAERDRLEREGFPV